MWSKCGDSLLTQLLYHLFNQPCEQQENSLGELYFPYPPLKVGDVANMSQFQDKDTVQINILDQSANYWLHPSQNFTVIFLTPKVPLVLYLTVDHTWMNDGVTRVLMI